eukprot:scaffold283_cov110-Isochrysis_galbana.AAC.5
MLQALSPPTLTPTPKVGNRHASCVNLVKKKAKQAAALAMLRQLYPHVDTWGQLVESTNSRQREGKVERARQQRMVAAGQRVMPRDAPPPPPPPSAAAAGKGVQSAGAGTARESSAGAVSSPGLAADQGFAACPGSSSNSRLAPGSGFLAAGLGRVASPGLSASPGSPVVAEGAVRLDSAASAYHVPDAAWAATHKQLLEEIGVKASPSVGGEGGVRRDGRDWNQTEPEVGQREGGRGRGGGWRSEWARRARALCLWRASERIFPWPNRALLLSMAPPPPAHGAMAVSINARTHAQLPTAQPSPPRVRSGC